MTITYLEKTQTTTVNANGRARIKIGPDDTGQFWAPNFVRVSTSSVILVNKQAAHCTVYEGAPGILDATTFVDDTFLGTGDYSSVIAGTVVQRGQVITADWVSANPGDVAVLTVYGRVADSLPEIASVLGLIPGARFLGSSALVPVDTVYQNQVTYNLAAGNSSGFQFNVNGAPGLYVSLSSTSAFPIGIDIGSFLFGPNLSGTATQVPLQELIAAPGSNVTAIVPIFGPTVTGSVFGPSGNATSGFLTLTSSRQQSGMPIALADENVLMERTNIAAGAGATVNFDTLRTWPGNVQLSVDSNCTAWETSVQYMDINGTFHIISRTRRSAPGEANVRLLLPAAPIRFTFINTSGAAGAFNSYMVGQPIDKDF